MELTRDARPGLDPEVLRRAAEGVVECGPLTFLVGDDSVTYRAEAGSIKVEPGRHDGATTVRLTRQSWEDLVGQVRTFVGLFLAGDLTIERGRFEQLADWDPVLKYLHAGIPPYDPRRVAFCGRRPETSFPASADDAELAAQLTTMGFLHVKGVFATSEMEAANREVDRLAALARPGDDQSWWATAEDESQVLCRLVYASLRSPLLAALENDGRVRRLGTLLDPTLKPAPDRMEGASVLIKVPGRTVGLSNIPWHQDCGTGGHAIFCPAVAVGIQLTGSDEDTGTLQVVPGSHGQTLHYRWEDRLADVPVVSVSTDPGDLTVHIQDVMHASPKPAGAGGRRTMYVTFYPARLWDHIGPGQALNDLVRNRTERVSRLQETPPGPNG